MVLCGAKGVFKVHLAPQVPPSDAGGGPGRMVLGGRSSSAFWFLLNFEDRGVVKKVEYLEIGSSDFSHTRGICSTSLCASFGETPRSQKIFLREIWPREV